MHDRHEGVGAQVLALTATTLAGRIAESAHTMLITGVPSVRLGIDGPVEADAGDLADDVAGALHERAVPVARVRATDFLRARSLRLEFGRDDPDAFHDLWYDVPALRREVLDPLGPNGDHRWLPKLRDPITDRPARVPARTAPQGTVLVLDGRFLLRPDLRSGFDLTVHLDVSAGARARRVPDDERGRLLPAWQRYIDETDPVRLATLVVRHDHPDRPALLVR